MKKHFSLLNAKKLAVNLLWELAGSLFIAAGIYNFAVQAEFPMTGFSGVALILYRLVHIPIGLSTVLLNIPVAILSYRLLGRKFFISSVRCMILSSILIDYAPRCFQPTRGAGFWPRSVPVYSAGSDML